MFIAYYIAKVFTSGVKQMRCIALECGLQNGTLAYSFLHKYLALIYYTQYQQPLMHDHVYNWFYFYFFLRKSN